MDVPTAMADWKKIRLKSSGWRQKTWRKLQGFWVATNMLNIKLSVESVSENLSKFLMSAGTPPDLQNRYAQMICSNDDVVHELVPLIPHSGPSMSDIFRWMQNGMFSQSREKIVGTACGQKTMGMVTMHHIATQCYTKQVVSRPEQAISICTVDLIELGLFWFSYLHHQLLRVKWFCFLLLF